MMARGCCAGGVHGNCAGWCYAAWLLGCPIDGDWCLVCELCRLAVVCVDCRCFLSFDFLGGARRVGLSPFTTRLNYHSSQQACCCTQTVTYVDCTHGSMNLHWFKLDWCTCMNVHRRTSLRTHMRRTSTHAYIMSNQSLCRLQQCEQARTRHENAAAVQAIT